MTELALREPSPSDWDRWEARLLAGEEPSTAAKEEGQTCSSFKRQNRERHADALELSREARGHYADERAEKWALDPDADDRMRERWLRRWNAAYAQGTRVEIAGPDGGPVQIEDRSAHVADVARVLEAVGALAQLGSGTAERALPPAREILAAPPES